MIGKLFKDLTAGGYRKVGRAFGAWIAQVMARYDEG